MQIKLAKGEYSVLAKLENTPIRTLGNSLSLVSWITLLGLLMWKLKKLKVFT